MLATKTLSALAAGLFAVAASASEPITSDQFAPGWQDHAHALINGGAARDLSKTAWLVPSILPPGRYVLVTRNGDKAELIDGYEFTMTRTAAAQDIHMIVPQRYFNVEALPLADVPALAARRTEPTGSR